MKSVTLKNPFIIGEIPADKIAQSIAHHQEMTHIGGHSIFLGQVRSDIIEEKKVIAIEFTAYEEMAIKKLAEIREQIFAKYELSCMHVYHSLGTVPAGKLCLFVFTSSAHRKPAQQACDELVERIKAELPIWGKEILEDHTFEWKTNH